MFYAKHYHRVSDLLRELDVSEETREALARLFCAFFREDNPRFDEKRWWKEVRYGYGKSTVCP